MIIDIFGAMQAVSVAIILIFVSHMRSSVAHISPCKNASAEYDENYYPAYDGSHVDTSQDR